MKKTLNKIVFFGNERLATGITTNNPVLRSLVNDGYDVCTIVINDSGSTSRKKRLLEVEEVAKLYKIPILSPKKLIDIVDTLAKFGAEAGILVAYGKIIPQSIIDIFPNGIVNIHPSALPKHRGPTPIESVILNRETKTAISLMKLAKAMDAGPIYAQQEISLSGKESKQELVGNILNQSAKLLIDTLPGILSGELKPMEQDNNEATYDSLIAKENGKIEWSKSAEMLDAEIRAYLNWPGSITLIADKPVIITLVEIIDKSGVPGSVSIESDSLLIYCSTKALKIIKLKPVGKREMTAKEFIAGYGKTITDLRQE